MKIIKISIILFVCLLNINKLECFQLKGPVYGTFINILSDWWPPEKIAASLGVPGFAAKTNYNVFVLTFWLSKSGPYDAALVYSDPVKYMGTDSIFGKTKSEIQKNIMKRFHDNNKYLIVSAFGATDYPTNTNPNVTCSSLGKFVVDNQLDGVDLDYEDSSAFTTGKGEQWLIDCTKKLRSLLPQSKYILTHAPQAPYFTSDQNFYPKKAYKKIHSEVGNLIDWYFVQFYNQDSNSYDTYIKLFTKSGAVFPGTSVQEINKLSNVPLQKIVVTKPSIASDAVNTGFLNFKNLGQYALQAYQKFKWNSGIATWQYSNDKSGTSLQTYLTNSNQKVSSVQKKNKKKQQKSKNVSQSKQKKNSNNKK